MSKKKFGPGYGVEENTNIEEIEPEKILSKGPTKEDWDAFLSAEKLAELKRLEALHKPSEFAKRGKKKK